MTGEPEATATQGRERRRRPLPFAALIVLWLQVQVTVSWPDFPLRVGVLLGLDERALVVVRGVEDSGMLLTDRHIFAWRPSGVAPRLAIDDVRQVQVARGPLDMLVLAPDTIATPLVLLSERRERRNAERLVDAMVALVDVPADASGRAAVRIREHELADLRVVTFERDR